MRLGSGIAVAVVWAGGCSSDLTPSLGTSICCRYGPKTIEEKKICSLVDGPTPVNERFVKRRANNCVSGCFLFPLSTELDHKVFSSCPVELGTQWHSLHLAHLPSTLGLEQNSVPSVHLCTPVPPPSFPVLEALTST